MYIKPKKSLGQNFLIDKNIHRKIIGACNFSNHDIVLEIGAGTGEFSAEVAAKVKDLYAKKTHLDKIITNIKSGKKKPKVRSKGGQFW